MEVLPRYKEVLALGRKLVDELGKQPPPRVLCRWMAHYIAELIDAADNALPQERAARQQKCYDAILQLWERHATFPGSKDPFKAFKPIVRALKRLDPDDEQSNLINCVTGGDSVPNEDPYLVPLLEFARLVESTARRLVYYTFIDAARTAKGRSREWLELATNANLEVPVVELIIQFGVDADGREEDPRIREREEVEKHMQNLDEFVAMATELRAKLSTQLQGS